MAENQDVQDKVHEELESVLGADGIVTPKNMGKLVYAEINLSSLNN